MFSSLDPINPTVNVVGFLQAISRQFPSTIAVSTRIWDQDRVVVLYQPPPETIHPHPVVRDTVQKNDSVAVCVFRTHEPCPQNSTIRRCEVHVAERHPSFLRSG